jgi:uncharacterized protein
VPASLSRFLDHPSRPAGTLSYHELQGFLFTLASAPELVLPSEWLPLIFGEGGPEFENENEAQAILDQIMGLYNAINGTVQAPPAELPEDCLFREDVLANLEDDAPVAQWSRGFLYGHQWLEEVWGETVPEELDEEFGSILMTLTFFSSRRIAEAFHAETNRSGISLESMAGTIREVFAAAITEYADLGRTIAAVLAERDESPGEPARSEKIGRNEPCGCGSGKKYKKCCGATLH